MCYIYKKYVRKVKKKEVNRYFHRVETKDVIRS